MRHDPAYAQQVEAEADGPTHPGVSVSTPRTASSVPRTLRTMVRDASLVVRWAAMSSPVLGEAVSGWDCLMYDTVDSNLVGRGSSVSDTYSMFTSTTELQYDGLRVIPASTSNCGEALYEYGFGSSSRERG